jgi:hypothetical protein
MRLTLRTLLAWLDDMLPNQEVREIGQQVSESSFARELVERIRRVTRQRRLSVPVDDGQEVNDPNRVAEYLDNVLSPEQVAEFERLCLKSDVHLAEVASAHQILSLLGQRAKVPPDARYRMYHLVKGRETIGERAKRDHREVRTEPVSATLPLSTPGTEPRAWGPARTASIAAALILGALLAWSTWENLRPLSPPVTNSADAVRLATRAAQPPRGQGPATPPVLAQQPGAPAPPADASPPDEEVAKRQVDGGELEIALAPAVAAAKAVAGLPSETPDAENADAAEVMVEEVKPSAEGGRDTPKRAERVVPAGEVGTVKGSDGVLLRRSGQNDPWERLAEGATLSAGETLVNLDPYRSEIDLAPMRLRLVRNAALELREPADGADEVVELRQGRFVARAGPPAQTLALDSGPGLARIALPANVPVGFERASDWKPGAAANADPGLLVYLPQGEMEVSVGETSETFRGPAVVEIDATGKTTSKPGGLMPEWVLEQDTPALDAETGRQFLRFFRDGQPPLPNLVEAASSDRPEIRRLAMEALGQIGQYSIVVAALSAPDQPETRRAAIDVLRAGLAQGAPSSERLQQELERTGDEAWVDLVGRLLAGVQKAEESDPGPALLQLLDHQDVGIRELALDNLMRLTNRGDSLGYNADAPTPETLRAWSDLVQSASGREARNPRP